MRLPVAGASLLLASMATATTTTSPAVLSPLLLLDLGRALLARPLALRGLQLAQQPALQLQHRRLRRDGLLLRMQHRHGARSVSR
jgi:hypothetical protein